MIDIVIPAHNCKATLPRTLGSIAAQTEKEKCIVTVVDDASDEEQDLEFIVDTFRQYLAIRFIRLEKNLKYPGLVRQVGIDYSQAPYIMFVDADDILEPRAVEFAHKQMLSTNADMSIGYFFAQQNGKYTLMTEKDTTWLHGNVYKRQFLTEKGIRFTPGYNEDGAFNTQCFMLSEKVVLLKSPIYIWVQQENSITRSEEGFNLKYGKDLVSTLKLAYQHIFSVTGQNKKNIGNLGFHTSLFFAFENDYLNSNYKEAKEQFDIELDKFYKEIKINLNNPDILNAFKAGMLKGLSKHFTSKTVMKVEDFFKQIGLDCEISINDFKLIAEEKEAHEKNIHN